MFILLPVTEISGSYVIPILSKDKSKTHFIEMSILWLIRKTDEGGSSSRKKSDDSHCKNRNPE
jgi:hypothetical protein